MALPNEKEALASAWRALTGSIDGDGWRTIPIVTGDPCHFLAGRHFPGNEEAILVGFRPVRLSTIGHLPEGNGFVVQRVELTHESNERLWFGLLRQPAGSLEMFTMMANDVIRTLVDSAGADEERLLSLFLGRIHAWQSFMLHGRDGVLSQEAEIGLHGELLLLTFLLNAGLPAKVVVDSWMGPLDGLHDFKIGTGAIEVKTTLSASGFSATISSLEQLDDSLVNPLFLFGARLRLDEKGLNLPDRISEIRDLIGIDTAALVAFEVRLLHAGFFSSMSARYPRRFSHCQTKIFQVADGFARLLRSDVQAEIRKVQYEIDLDMINSDDISFDVVLRALGGS